MGRQVFHSGLANAHPVVSGVACAPRSCRFGDNPLLALNRPDANLPAWRHHAVIWGFALLIALTTRWVVDEPDFTIHGYDSISYLAIARAVPGLATTIDLTIAYPEKGEAARQSPIPYHHAQRLTGAYLVGGVAKLTGATPETTFTVVSVLLLTATLVMLRAAGKMAGLGNRAGWLLAALFLANPYLVRFNLSIPTYTADSLFLLGTALILYGGLRRQFLLIALGLAVAAFGRQTALLLLPGLFLWLHVARLGSAGRHLALLGLAVGIYVVTGWIAGQMNPHSRNLEHVLGLGTWLRAMAGADDLAAILHGLVHELRPFLIRVFLPLAAPLAILAALAFRRGLKLDTTALAWGLMTLGVMAQPLLGGPLVTGNAGTRLTALGLLPLLLATARALDHSGVLERLRPGMLVTLGALLLASSLHHRYTPIASWAWAETAYATLVLGSLTALGLLLYRARAAGPAPGGRSSGGCRQAGSK